MPLKSRKHRKTNRSRRTHRTRRIRKNKSLRRYKKRFGGSNTMIITNETELLDSWNNNAQIWNILNEENDIVTNFFRSANPDNYGFLEQRIKIYLQPRFIRSGVKVQAVF